MTRNIPDCRLAKAKRRGFCKNRGELAINNDNIVDIFDIVTIAVAYGSRPGDKNWNPNADLYEDNVIDTIELFIARGQFGKTG